MLLRSTSIAALTAVVALSGVAGASAATKFNASGKTGPSRTKITTSVRVAKTKGKGASVFNPIKVGTPVAYISAFPTGGKGSGTEATCGLWSDRLQEDQNAQDEATDKQDIIDATETLNTDINNALDAGCVVIY